jgi:hypothetical protein
LNDLITQVIANGALLGTLGLCLAANWGRSSSYETNIKPWFQQQAFKTATNYVTDQMKMKAQMQQSQKQSQIQHQKAYWVTEPKEEINRLEQVLVISLYVKLLELGSIPLCLKHDEHAG